MMWLPLLKRFWPYLAGLVLLASAALYFRHQGYEAGYANREGFWRPKFDQAQKDLAAANARTEALEKAQQGITADVERRHAEDLAASEDRARRANESVGRLLRQLAVRASCGEVPAVPGSTPEPAATPESDRRAEEATGRLVGLAADCESDALINKAWQEWYREQRAARQ